MDDSPYRSSGLGSSETPVCLFCGWELAANAKRCEKCGVSCVAPNRDPLVSSHCPRCGSFLARKSFGRASMSACEKCHGVFLAAQDFTLVVTDYMNGVELPVGVELLPIAPGNEIDRIPIVKCLFCLKEMERVNFASRSDAIIDVCMVHGLWLDAGELVPMLHFVKTRADLGEVPLTDAEKQDLADLEKDREESQQRVRLLDLTALLMLQRSSR